MQHATVLDIRTRPYPDGLSVPAQHGPVPDARLLPNMNVPDNVGPRRHPRRVGDLWKGVAVGEQVATLV